ncbi:uncharacterized protein LOC124297740 [Neodiprion virginianus]|uniref:uncharacterized protein LOC124297740 n=1 Tax=Neodiprion virginianus TaxID=2961670 RepID=UPI001EE71CAC|nr:uncharacterized protein LOC124297740 [Neodiprion virginianus]
MTKIIKSLYDQATIQVRSRNAFSNEFAVTEGVLQGESLIPLLFLLYIADFEDFFRQRGLEGLNIDGIHDIVMLLYTDDTVILAQSQTDLAKKLRVLGEYCAENGLTVNSIKTSIIIFKNGGHPKALDPKYTRHMDKNIETVTTYNYLGIPLSSSSLGQLGAVNAINKAKISSVAALAILARAKSYYWKSFKHLYDSLISSTLLHGVPVWGLRYLDQIEKAQTGFFKYLLYLPSNTPNWALRLEMGTMQIAYCAMIRIWNWFMKILEMPENILPKLCMLRLMSLAERVNGPYELNWASQFREFSSETNCLDLWGTRDPQA